VLRWMSGCASTHPSQHMPQAKPLSHASVLSSDARDQGQSSRVPRHPHAAADPAAVAAAAPAVVVAGGAQAVAPAGSPLQLLEWRAALLPKGRPGWKQ